MVNWFQLFVTGIAVGSIYSLVGLGFVTIYRSSTVVNMAQGSFVMLGTMFASYFLDRAGLPFWLAGIVAVLVVVAIAMLVYTIVLKPLIKVSLVAVILSTVGLSILFENLAMVGFGSLPKSLPPFTGGVLLRFAGATFSVQYLWVIGIMIVVFVGLHLMNSYTRIGKKMSATAANPVAAKSVGISNNRMILLAFAISSAIGAVGGISFASLIAIGYGSGGVLMLNGFVAAIVGGWGSSLGALLGGLAIGIIQSMVTGFIPAGWQDGIAFGILVVVLYFRPRGLLGTVTIEEHASR